MVIYVAIGWFQSATEDTDQLASCGVDGPRSVWRAHPPFERYVKSFFMSLPVIFSFKRFRTECALKWMLFVAHERSPMPWQ